jgi:hypothetical protein
VLLHRAWRECQRVGNRGISSFLRYARENVALTRRELGNWGLSYARTLRDQILHHPRVKDGATLRWVVCLVLLCCLDLW